MLFRSERKEPTIHLEPGFDQKFTPKKRRIRSDRFTSLSDSIRKTANFVPKIEIQRDFADCLVLSQRRSKKCSLKSVFRIRPKNRKIIDFRWKGLLLLISTGISGFRSRLFRSFRPKIWRFCIFLTNATHLCENRNKVGGFLAKSTEMRQAVSI